MTNAIFPELDDGIVEATQWLLRLSDEDASGEDVMEWQQWLATSPAHRTAFERAQTVWDLSAKIDPVPWPTDREVMADSGAVAKPRRSTFWKPLATAAVLALVVVGTVAIWRHGANELTTSVGENKTFALTDGSKITLGGASQLHWSIDTQRRVLELKNGEAFFEVAKDPRRPFIVQAGKAQIIAVGTAFNVRKAADRVQVVVTDGAVKVGETRLEAGHQTTILREAISPPAPAEIPVVLARQRGRLQYTSEPLRYVVADLSRYSKVPIEIRGVHTGNMLVTGTVLESDLTGWLQGVEKALPVDVTFEQKRIVISAR